MLKYTWAKTSLAEESAMTETLDKTDIQMLRVLQQNARITVKDLALKVHLSPTPVFERLHRLENEGYIRRYTRQPLYSAGRV